jgi:histidine triad (HIT) family protein
VTTHECPFCAIVAGQAPATVLAEGPRVLIFQPLQPHAPGHALVVPRQHVADAWEDPDLTGLVFAAAARFLGRRQGNLLTSNGPLATQTVRHLHVHVVPRSERDGLHEDWPWLRDLFKVRR